MMRLTPISTRTDTLVPYTSLFRSGRSRGVVRERVFVRLYKNHNKLLGGHNEIEGKLVPRGVDCDVNGRRRPRLCPTGAIAGRRRRVAGEWGRGDRRHRLPHRPAGTPIADADRKSVVEGKSVSVRVDLGGRRIIKKKINIK